MTVRVHRFPRVAARVEVSSAAVAAEIVTKVLHVLGDDDVEQAALHNVINHLHIGTGTRDGANEQPQNMTGGNNAATDKGKAKARESSEEHDCVASCICSACPSGFRHTERLEAQQETKAAQEDKDEPAALGRNIHYDEEHHKATGVGEQRPSSVG